MTDPTQSFGAVSLGNIFSPEAESSIRLDMINVLVDSYKKGKSSHDEVVVVAGVLISEIQAIIHPPNQMSHARECCVSLLALPIEEIQKKVIQVFSECLSIETLKYDVENNQAQSLVLLEEKLNAEIEFHLSREGSSELLSSLLNLYEDLLEHMWLLPHLQADLGVRVIIVERAMPVMLIHTEKWFQVLEKRADFDKQLKRLFYSVKQSLDRIREEMPERVFDKLGMLKQSLGHPLSSTPLGDLCRIVKSYRRAIIHYKTTLCFFNRIEAAGEQVSGELKGPVLGNLGIAYTSTGEFEEAIKYHLQNLEIAQKIGDPKQEGRACGNLGIAYRSLGQYNVARDYILKEITIAQKTKDQEEEGSAYNSLGVVYNREGDFNQAIEACQHALAIAKQMGNRKEEAAAHCNLGNNFCSLSQYKKAIEHHNSYLQISQKIKDRRSEGTAYGNLGVAYHFLGEYETAVEYHQRYLVVAKETGDRPNEMRGYSHLGNDFYSLGQYEKAAEYQRQSLSVAEAIKDQGGIEQALGNLGNIYEASGHFDLAQKFYLATLKIAEKIGDRKSEGETLVHLGSVSQALGDNDKAIEYGKRGLEISKKLSNRSNEAAANGVLGLAYLANKQYPLAIECFTKQLEIAKEIGNSSIAGRAYGNLAVTFVRLQEYKNAEENAQQSIKEFSKLQLGNQDEWKITIFEEQFLGFYSLENLFLLQGAQEKALEVSDSRRSRALIDILLRSLNVKEHENRSASPLSCIEMQAIAKQFDTTFVVYSLVPLSQENRHAAVWVVPPQGNIFAEQIPLSAIAEDIEEFDAVLRQYPFNVGISRSAGLSSMDEVEELCRGKRQQALLKKKIDEFRKRLGIWYQTLIKPIVSMLPAPDAKVTFVPDGFLSQLPFAIFTDEDGNYLIEKFAISIAPSIKILQLLDAKKQTMKPGLDHCLVGNPDTGDPKDDLPQAEEEVGRVLSLLDIKTSVFIDKNAVVSNVTSAMQEARYIHLACHGDPRLKTDVYSVFEGGFLLSPDDETQSGILYAQKIADLSLQAELVFMSACYSGRGKIQKEGVIGNMRSFIAGGVLSTVGTYWRLPDSELTVDMVIQFYQHILGTSEKAQSKGKGLDKDEALREAMLMAISRERERPHAWGAFFLTGLV